MSTIIGGPLPVCPLDKTAIAHKVIERIQRSAGEFRSFLDRTHTTGR
jgi:hypothetical protein